MLQSSTPTDAVTSSGAAYALPPMAGRDVTGSETSTDSGSSRTITSDGSTVGEPPTDTRLGAPSERESARLTASARCAAAEPQTSALTRPPARRGGSSRGRR